MQTFAVTDLIKQNTIEAVGALDFDERDAGISPRRLPAWTRMQLPALMDVMVRMPSGVRLRFDTNSETLGIHFLATNLVTPPAERRLISFSLEVGGQLQHMTSEKGNSIIVNRADRNDFKLERGEADTLSFDLPGQGQRTIDLWLPHNAYVELRGLHLDDGATIQAASPDQRSRWIHYGSSISHCMEAQHPALIWPAVAARTANLSLHNLGFGGQCHLDQFVARTIRDSDADRISIKTGINVINMDSMKERIFEPALHGFLDTIRERHEETPIHLISAIYCPSAEDNPGPTLPNSDGKFRTLPGYEEVREGCMTLSRTRKILERVVSARTKAGDPNLHYVDGLSLFSEKDAADLPDDLHPNPEGYIRMGERFAKVLNSPG